MITIQEINSRRIAQDLQQLSRIGATAKGGVTRLAYTELEREAHRWLETKMDEIGLDVRVDAVGNTIGRGVGTGDGLPMIVLGSHLDSVVDGGNFDGTVGIVVALEMMRVLKEQHLSTQHPLVTVAFAAEEGARFGAAMMGSKAVVGQLKAADLDRLRDSDGVSLREAMGSLGFNTEDIPQARWESNQIAAFIEMHIEQSGVLEALKRSVGIVEAIGAATRLRVRLLGRADHSGATPMTMRQDALVAAAEMVLKIEDIAKNMGHSVVATVGRLRVKPNVITVIPGEVEFDIDIRDIDAEMKQMARNRIEEMVQEVARCHSVSAEIDLISDQVPTTLPIWIREVLRGVCQDMRLPYRVMTSGAQHDAAMIAGIAPTAMLFVPSKSGISHSPEEWTEVSDIVVGLQVLINAVLRLDEALLKHRAGVRLGA